MPHSIHRWLTELEHTACGLRRPHVVRGWQEVTCQRCLNSIHAKLAQWQDQQPESVLAPTWTPPRQLTLIAAEDMPTYRITSPRRRPAPTKRRP